MANLLPNPGAETDTIGWSASNATLSRVTTPVRTGVGAFSVAATAAGNVNLVAADVTTGLTPGANLTLTASVRSAATARSVAVKVDWYSASGYVSTTSATNAVVTSTTTSFTTVTGTITMPATATKGSLYGQVSGAAAGEVHYWDDFLLEAVAAPPTITAFAPARTVWKDPISLTASGVNYTSLSWDVTAAPAGSTATITGPTTATPTFTPQKPGPHTFTVTATGPGGTTTSAVTVDVRRQFLRYTATGTAPGRFLRY